MDYVKENRNSLIEIRKNAPEISAPYHVETKKNNRFYNYDSVANYIIKGYERGPENSYAADLNKEFPLLGK